MNIRWSHAVMRVKDLDAMVEVYCDAFGWRVADLGEVGPGTRIAFLSGSSSDHHQLGLLEGRTDDGTNLEHNAFRVDSVAEVLTMHARMDGDDRLVVRVEEVVERRIGTLVPRDVLLEEERLEEPGGVGPVPLRRAGLGHRLHDLVLERQRGGQRCRRAAHVGEALPQIGAPVGGGGVDDRHALLLEVAPSGWRVG